MTLVNARSPLSRLALGSVEQLLDSGLEALDITPAEHDAVERRYTALGLAFDDHWEQTRSTNTVFPQGSFRLGTVTRRAHRGDDIDIDLVASRDLSRDSTTQQELKADAGTAIKRFARAQDLRPSVEESDRCWTLQYSGMHMDVLPALDDANYGSGVLITDHDVRTWQRSDPRGYAEWFIQEMESERDALRHEYSNKTDIEAVPEFAVKTVLQRVVQALKRHRDIYFRNNLDSRPSSIVITTLAAHAYGATTATSLYDALRSIPRLMPSFLSNRQGQWFLPNPAQPEENFTDYWNVDVALARNFEEWLSAATAEFDSIGARSGMHNVIPRIGEAFGTLARDGALHTAGADGFRARVNGDLYVAEPAPAATRRRVNDHGFAGGTQ